MALTCTNRGVSGNNSSSTSVSISPGSNCTAGAMIWLFIAYDNSGTSGADAFSSISDSAGNTWTLRQNASISPGSAANDGTCCRAYSTMQNGGTLTTSSTITVSFSTNTVNKVWALVETTASAGIPSYLTGSISTQTSSAPTITSGSITSGDAIIGFLGSEGNTATGDSDTSNGTWSTHQQFNFGSGAAGHSMSCQHKVTTGTGTQTYNPTLTSSRDLCIGYVVITELTTYTATTSLTGSSTTISASATFAPGTKTATASLSGGSTTLAASATFAAGTKTATASLTGSSTTLAASATFSAGTKTATAALAGGSTTIAASATFTARLRHTSRGSGFDNTSGTSVAISPTSNCTAGATVWLAVAYDNAGTNGSDPFSAISDTNGNTWTLRQNGLNDPAGANHGVVLRLYTTRQNGGTLTTGSTITLSFSTSVTSTSWLMGEVSSSWPVTIAESGVENEGATSTPSVTTGTLQTGDILVGVLGFEGNSFDNSLTDDSDTSNGSWGSGTSATAGFDTNLIGILRQVKTITGSGSQTYNPTIGFSSDSLIGYLVFREAPYSATVALSGGSTTLSASATFAAGTRTASAALTGGSTTLAASATFSTTRTASVTLTGGSTTLAASATFAAGTKTATASLTTGSTSLSATATMTAPVYTASASLSGGSTTLAAIGTFSEAKTATVTLIGGSTVLAAVIDVTNPTYSATAALTTGSTTLSATARFSVPTFGGMVWMLIDEESWL